MATSKLQALWNHPAGPKTTGGGGRWWLWWRSLNPRYLLVVVEEAPMAAEVTLYLSCPCHLVTAVAATGIVWSRYSTIITPKNWNLFSVNVAMAGTGLYQLSRKLQ
ncbi:hypothetical protein C3L33_06467, partial [Rhododendron williamsianum]